MDTNLVILIIIGCCFFCICMIFLASSIGGGESSSWLSRGLILDALQGFKFEDSSAIPNIQRRLHSVRPQTFEVRTNFTAPPSQNLGDPRPNMDNADCSALCFDTENCTGYTIEGQNCQLKGNVVIINYEKGKEIRVSGDVGGTKFGQVPYDISNKGQPVYKTLTNSTIASAITTCYEDSACKGFTYENGTANLYANVLVVETARVGNTYIKFDSMANSGFRVAGRKYTDTGATATYHVDDQFFKPATFAPPPAAPPGSEPWQIYPSDMKFFKIWEQNWNAGRTKEGTDPTAGAGLSVDSLEHCANLCLSNSSCKSFVWAKDGSKKCWFRRDLTRDNDIRYVCDRQYDTSTLRGTAGCRGDEVVAQFTNGGLTCGPHAVSTCWTDPGSKSDSSKDTYFKLQDPLSQTCPESCGQDPACHAAQWTTNDCTMMQFQPTVAAQDINFTTQWKFDYFPGQ